MGQIISGAFSAFGFASSILGVISFADKTVVKNLDRNYEAINRNYDAINKNYDAIREVGSKVDRNLKIMVSMFDLTAKNLNLLRENLKTGFKELRDYVKKTKVESVTSDITFYMDQLFEKQALLPELSKDELIIFLEGNIPSKGALDWLQNNDILHKSLVKIIELDFIIPETPEDEIAFKTIQLLITGLHTYLSVVYSLVSGYKYASLYHYELNNFDKFNQYLSSLSLNLKDFDEILNGEQDRNGLFKMVENAFENVENIKFVREERQDIIRFLSKYKNSIQKLRNDFKNLKESNKLVQFKPTINMEYDFSKSKIETPFSDWVDGQKVSYAIQLKNGTQFSQISEWSDEYELDGKACPLIKLTPHEKNEERIIFRKIGNRSEFIMIIKDKDQTELRDIDKDLFNLLVLNANEDLAIKRMEILLDDGANLNYSYKDEKPLIHYLIEKNRIKLAFHLIKNKINLNLKDSEGLQPLHVAINSNQSKALVEALIENGANVTAETNLKWTPFLYSVKVGNEELKNLLIEKGANISSTTENNFNALHIASSSGSKNNLLQFLIQNLNINQPSKGSLTPLHLAVLSENQSIVKTLLNNSSINVNCKNEDKLTPLHLAVQTGNLEIVKLLLNHKEINVNQLSSNGWSPLHLAILSEKEDVALELLKSNGIKIDIADKMNLTPLHIASIRNETKIVSGLLDKNVKVESRDQTSSTALHFASEKGTIEVVKLLINKGKASINVKERDGNTPLILASISNHLDVVKYLVNSKALINERNKQNNSAIDLASLKGKYEIVNYLKKEGADYSNLIYQACYGNQLDIVKEMVENDKSILKKLNERKNSILHYAALGGSYEIIKYLFEKYNLNGYFSNEDGDTILHLAVSTDNFELVKYLCSKHIDLNTVNNENYSIVLKAASLGNWAAFLHFLNKNVDAKIKANNGNSFLHYACRDNELDIVNYALDDLKMDVNDKNEDGWTALFFAAKNGNLSLIKYLIEEKNANYEILDKNNRSLLSISIESRNLDTIKYFLGKLDVNSPKYSTSPLHLAALSDENLEIAELLLKKGSKIDEFDENQNTPLQLAAKTKSWKIVKLLIENNANIQLADKINDSVLHQIAKSDNLEILKFLENKRSLNKSIKNNQGMTPVHYSAQNSQFEMARYLLEIGFVYDEDIFKNTPIHYSAKANDFLLTVYLANKFDFDLKNKEQKTPLALTEDESIVKFLIEEKNVSYNNNLFFNIGKNNLGILKYLIKYLNQDPNVVENGQTILTYAVDKNKTDIVKYLVNDLKMDINKKDELDALPIDYAFNYKETQLFLEEMNNSWFKLSIKSIFEYIGNLKMVKYFTEERGLNVNLTDNFQNSLLSLASGSSSSQSLEVVKYLLEKGANLSSTNELGNSVLHNAAFYNKLDVVKFFVEVEKMGPSFPNKFKNNALHMASMNNGLEVIKYLINSKNMDINIPNNITNTPIHEAARFDNLEVVKFFVLEKKIDPNLKGNDDCASIHFACQGNNLNIVKFLIKEANVDPYSKSGNESSPLHITSRLGHFEVTKFLTDEIGVDVNVRSGNNDAPIHLASEFGKFGVLKFLVEIKNVDVNLRGYNNEVPLHDAIRFGGLNILKYLLSKNANPYLKNKDGESILDYAKSRHNENIVEYLKKNYPDLESSEIKNNLVLNISNEVKENLVIEGINDRKEMTKLLLPGSDDFRVPTKGNRNLNVQNADLNSSLMLFNVFIRKLTKQTFIQENKDQRKLSLIDSKMIALNIIELFENKVEKACKKLKITFKTDILDPASLINEIVWNLRNQKFNEILNLFNLIIKNNYQELENNKKFKLKLQNDLENSLISNFNSFQQQTNGNRLNHLKKRNSTFLYQPKVEFDKENQLRIEN